MPAPADTAPQLKPRRIRRFAQRALIVVPTAIAIVISAHWVLANIRTFVAPGLDGAYVAPQANWYVSQGKSSLQKSWWVQRMFGEPVANEILIDDQLPPRVKRWIDELPPATGMALMREYGPLNAMYFTDLAIRRTSQTHGALHAFGKRLPIGIRPLRFAVLIVLTIALFEAILFGLRAARTRRRRARNRCIHCNYDRAGLASDVVCPECGKL